MSVIPRIALERSSRTRSRSSAAACSLMRVKYAVAIDTVITECGSMKMSHA